MKVKDLTPAAYNPRTITDAKLAALGKSMQEFGDLSGVVVNIGTGNLVGGHQRLKNFDPSWPIKKRKATDSTGTVALGEIETPFGVWQYREVSWPKQKEIAANISANQSGGQFDEPLLNDLLLEIQDGAFALDIIGFDEAELKELFTKMDDAPGAMSKNFNAGYGGAADHDSAPADIMHSSGVKYPVTFLLSQEEYDKWEWTKQSCGVQNDKSAFLKLIGGENA